MFCFFIRQNYEKTMDNLKKKKWTLSSNLIGIKYKYRYLNITCQWVFNSVFSVHVPPRCRLLLSRPNLSTPCRSSCSSPTVRLSPYRSPQTLPATFRWYSQVWWPAVWNSPWLIRFSNKLSFYQLRLQPLFSPKPTLPNRSASVGLLTFYPLTQLVVKGI